MLVNFRIVKSGLFFFIISMLGISIFNIGSADSTASKAVDYESILVVGLRDKLRLSKTLNIKYRPTSNTTSRGMTENAISLHWRYSFGINCPIDCGKYFKEIVTFLEKNVEEVNAKCLSNNVGIKIEFLTQEGVVIERMYADSSGRCLKIQTTGQSYIIRKGFNLVLRDLWLKTSP